MINLTLDAVKLPHLHILPQLGIKSSFISVW